MEILIVFFISGLTALFIALPFFLGNKSGGLADVETGGTVDPILEHLKALQGRKESLYTAIRDIDLDYGLGKLTEEDYEELRQKYRIEAASVLREIEGITKDSGTGSIDADIEEQIKKSRSVSSQNPEEDDIENEILQARKSAQSEFSVPKNLSCTDCGNTYTDEELFCSKCGAKLNG